jgi:hypothetical protein
MIAMVQQIWYGTAGLLAASLQQERQPSCSIRPGSSGPLGRREAEEWLDWFENHSIRTCLNKLTDGCFEIRWDSHGSPLSLKA